MDKSICEIGELQLENTFIGIIESPKPPVSTIFIGGDGKRLIEIGVDKKFNWFQKKMIKWCFGFEVKENK